MKTRWLIHFTIAIMAISGTVMVLSSVHDYRRTRFQIDLMRTNNPIAIKRPWIVVEYFMNEAGSGIKYALTDNPKYMIHYPTESYIIKQALLGAAHGNWRDQVTLARMYYDGSDLLPRNIHSALLWMKNAKLSAPFHAQYEISAVIMQIEKEIGAEHI